MASGSPQVVKIRCEGSRTMPLAALEGLQGELKKISDDNLARLKDNITRDGFIAPIFVWVKNGNGAAKVLDGHQRMIALRELIAEGWKVPELPVADVHADSEREARRLLLQIASQFGRVTPMGLEAYMAAGRLDYKIVAPQISIPNIYMDEGREWKDPPERRQVEARTKRGDLWLLGEHRLLCGDSAEPKDVDRLVDGAEVHLVNADSPYNVGLVPDRASHGYGRDKEWKFGYSPRSKPASEQIRAKERPLIGDFISDEQFDALLAAWFGNIARVLLPGGSYYLWAGYSNLVNYPPALRAAGLYFSQMVIWAKDSPMLVHKDFLAMHEVCFYGWREGAGHKWYGPKNVPDVWNVPRLPRQDMVHLTEKPLQLALDPIKYSSRPGDNVLDLFGGGGFTLLAAEQLDRRAFLMELDPAYCDVIVDRWEQLAGKKGRLGK